MSDFFGDVIRFHKAIGHPVGTTPKVPDGATAELRYDLIREEMSETLDALLRDDLVGIADGIADSIVVLLGTAAVYGIDIDAVFTEVCRSNLSKVGGPVRADGKQLKHASWTAPDIAGILSRQGPIGGGS